MAIKHDAQGFLVGDPIDLGVTLKALESIRNDVQAIRKAVTGAAASMTAGAKRQSGKEQAAAVIALPAGRRGGNANDTTRRAQTPSGKSRHAAAAVRQESRAATKTVAVPAGRDGRGRFVAGNARIDSGLHDRDARTGDSTIRGFTDRVVSAMNGASGGMEEADPAVKAFNEVAQPMARGYEMLTGGSEDKKQTGLLRRVFGTLDSFRKEESAFNKAANRSLKNIEAKPASGENGSGGIWGTILSAIMGIGPAVLAGIGTLLSKIPGLGSLFGGGSGAAGGAANGAGGFFKGALKKIPLLGALLAVGGAATDIYGSENDDKLSRREKDKNAGKAIGGAGGTIAGMAAGAAAGAFAGPIGMVIGGMVGAFLGDQAGQIIGDKVGGWVNDLRSADIVGTITAAWDGVVSGFKSTYDNIGKTWGRFVDSAKAGWDTIAGLFSSAYEGLKSIPVIGPAIQAVEDAAKKTAAAASATVAAAKAKAVEVGTKAAEVGTKAVEGVKQGAEYLGNNTTIGKGVKAAGSWVLGQTSKLFESGKGGAATVSSGKGDYGGASYGTYQLSSKQGEVQKFLKGSKYGEQFAGLQPGTPEFNAKWKEVAKADPEFGSAQHDYIKSTKFDPAMAGLKKSGIDLSKDGAAVQDAVWSTSVQFGAGGAQSLVKNAFKGKDVSKMTEAEKISAIQDYKIANNDKLFSKSDANVRAGTAKRAVEEKKRLLALADQDAPASPTVNETIGGGTQTAQAGQITYPQKAPVEVAAISPKAPALVATASLANVQTAHIAMPPVVSPPSVPVVSEPPPVVDTLASNTGSGRKTQAITVAAPEVGQDIKDRRIAHIVTGGMSAT